MSRKKRNEVHLIDLDIKNLKEKRDVLTRDEMHLPELLQYLENYQEFLEVEEELAKSTVKNYVRNAEMFLEEYCSANQATNKKVTLQYKEASKEKYKSLRTINHKITTVSKFLVYCGLFDCRMKKIIVQDNNVIEDVIEVWEFKRLLSMANKQAQHDKTNEFQWEEVYHTIKLFGYSGIRVEERQFFKIEDLKKNQDLEVFFKGKWKKIMIRQDIRRDLIQYAKKHNITKGSIFKLNGSQISRRLKKLASLSSVKVQKIHPHAFRHFFAIQFMANGGDLSRLQQLLGHSSIQTTAIYLKETSSNLRKSLDAMSLKDINVEMLGGDLGSLIKQYTDTIYDYKKTFTKKAAIDMFAAVLQNHINEN